MRELYTMPTFKHFLRKIPGAKSGCLWAKSNPFKAFLLPFLVVPTFLFLGFLMLLYAGVFGNIPDAEALKNIEFNFSSEVYSADGALLGRYFIENRRPTKSDEMSPYLTQALVATEDERFYEHHGIDYKALGRVAWRTVLMQQEGSGGGSTITQQLAKNIYPRRDYWLFSVMVNKAREMAIAQRLETIYPKDSLLVLYLNTIPFSGDAFGIKVACQRFFDTTPSEIKPEEAAVLIGMLKATTSYHPLRNPERSKTRRNVVLSRMEKQGFIAPHICDSLQKLPLALKYNRRTHNDGVATYFREQLRQELDKKLQHIKKPDGTPYNLYADGLKIYTTLDSRMQGHAEKAVAEEMKKIQSSYYKHFKNHKAEHPYGNDIFLGNQVRQSERARRYLAKGHSLKELDSLFAVPVKMNLYNWKTGGELDTMLSPLDSVKYVLSLMSTGFLAVKTNTGEVLSWVGGVNFKYNKFDHVKSRRQVGSTFKPILYAQALEAGISPCKHFRNEHKTYEEFDNWAPRNVDEKYGGSYNIQGALRKSVNVVAVQVILLVGVDSVRNMAAKMGITSPIPKEAGIALGGVDISLYEMVHAFATIGNKGNRPAMHLVTKVVDKYGNIIIENKPDDKQLLARAMSETHAAMLIKMLEKVVDHGGTASRIKNLIKEKINLAGKTGTSNNNRDGWFVGLTPDITFGAWVGGDQQYVHFHDTDLGQGSSTAMPICANFLHKIYTDPIWKKWEKNDFPELDSLSKDRLACLKKVVVDSTAVAVDSVGIVAPSAEVLENEVFN